MAKDKSNPKKTIRVTKGADLKQALEDAGPTDTIVLDDPNSNFNLVFPEGKGSRPFRAPKRSKKGA